VRIKETYEKEMKFIRELHTQHIFQINKNWTEENENLKSEHEIQIEEMTKRFEDEKTEILKKERKSSEFQKRYLQEMQDLQAAFENFKIKTYEEFKNIKKQKEDLYYKFTHYKDRYENLLIENKELQEQLKSIQSNNEIIKDFGGTHDVKFIIIFSQRTLITFLKQYSARLGNYVQK
jgi:hypothetical protein